VVVKEVTANKYAISFSQAKSWLPISPLEAFNALNRANKLWLSPKHYAEGLK
jgi:hypothetical protein